ncbi:MAG: insulinase family protein [Planctomycetes bacterium]|nr:insulinase family protein [Planctomycetota bacterium]NBY02116.1 insulinase family protein [Planctomycetota bacterium]
MAKQFFQHTFKNGLTLIAENMPHVRSATVNIIVPSGCAYDPANMPGISSVLSEIILRGAGKNNSKELSLAMDGLGLDRSCAAGTNHIRLWGATLSRNLPKTIDLFADIILKPHLPKSDIESVKMLAAQEIMSIEDDPKQKVMAALRKNHFPSPLGNDRRGTLDGLKAITHDALTKFWKKNFRPNGTIISVAGNIEWEPLKEQVEKLFGKWKEGDVPPLKLSPTKGGTSHISKDTQQIQIGIAYPSVTYGHKDFYDAIGAVNVLSGGMSSRLFTEVREKRGLCYSVWASYQNFKEVAAVICYAGTTTEMAQETLDVTLKQIGNLTKGIKEEEVKRLKIGLKSSMLIQEESSSARAGSIAVDWYYLGRVRPLEEIQKAIDSITTKSILRHVKEYNPKEFTIVTLGNKQLKYGK